MKPGFPSTRHTLRAAAVTLTGMLAVCCHCLAGMRGVAAPEDYSAARMLALWEQRTAGTNLARGAAVLFNPTPSYHLTRKGDSDALDLVDGDLCSGPKQAIWWEEKAVGWSGSRSAWKQIIVDLGQEHPVERVVWRVVAGCAKRHFLGPKHVRLYGGVDGKDVHLIRERLRWSEDAGRSDAYRLPNLGQDDTGDQVYVYPLTLDANGYRMRYVILEFEMDDNWLAADELAVIAAQGTGQDLRALPAHRLQTRDVWISADESSYPLPPDVALPLWLRQRDLRPGGNTLAVDYHLRIPPGLDIAHPSYYARTQEADGMTRVSCRTGGNSQRIGPFFVSGRLQEPVVLQVRAVGAQADPQDWQEIRFFPVTLPPPFRLTRLCTSIGWFVEREQDLWPGFLTAYQRLGFNTVPTFPRAWVPRELEEGLDPEALRTHAAPHLLTARGQRLQHLRDAGCRIVYMESPIHVVNWRYPEAAAEYKCQVPGGASKGHSFCPSYRGPYFHQEMQRIADQVRLIGPHDMVLWDWEIAGSGRWLGQSCSRCQDAYAASGAPSWDTYVKNATLDIVDALHQAVRGVCRNQDWPDPLFGMYALDATQTYSGLFDFLADGRMGIQSPSLYVGDDPAAVHRRIRAARDASAAPIIPWLTTGTYGYVPPRSARIMLWEAFLNGARGITYYSFADMNPAHLVEICEALAALAPLEQIIAEGSPGHQSIAVSPPHIRHSAMRLEKQAALLLVNPANTATTATWRCTESGRQGHAEVPARDARLLAIDI